MYLVKALRAVNFPTSETSGEVAWALNQLRLVEDSIIGRINAHPAVFSVLAGPEEAAVLNEFNELATVDTDSLLGINDWRLITGEGAPVNAIRATLLMASAGANNDLTFTSVAYGTDGNGPQVIIAQGAGVSVGLSVVVTGSVAGADWLATITLPTDGSAVAVAKTATQVKAAWDATAAALAVATVAVEGTGGGNVAAHAVGTLASGAGTGIALAGKGSVFIDTTTPGAYLNTGTKAVPAWTALATA